MKTGERRSVRQPRCGSTVAVAKTALTSALTSSGRASSRRATTSAMAPLTSMSATVNGPMASTISRGPVTSMGEGAMATPVTA